MDSRDDCLAHYPFVVVRIACASGRGAGPIASSDWLEIRAGNQPSRPDRPIFLRLHVARGGTRPKWQIRLWRLLPDLEHLDIIPQQDSAQNAFNKLARTFAAQVAALKDYRSKGEQKMTVQHVHVADGGQAVIGNVGTPPPGGGASEKMKEQPHALGYAPGVEMPRPAEAERATVPLAGDEASAGCTVPVAALPRATGTP